MSLSFDRQSLLKAALLWLYLKIWGMWERIVSVEDTMSRYVRGQDEGLAEVKGQTLRNVSLLENTNDKDKDKEQSAMNPLSKEAVTLCR